MEDVKPAKLSSYIDMGLDERILKAIADLGWKQPTLIQENAIPLALQGKDIVSRARTGSGKTGAFAIPLLHKILQRKQATGKQALRALILAPTKELSAQILNHVRELCKYCAREIVCVNLSAVNESLTQMTFFRPDVVISTPGKLLRHVKANELVSLKEELEFLVVDEADLMFSFGFEKDMKELVGYLPSLYQAFLTSATLSDDVKALKKLFLHNPVTLKLEDGLLPPDTQLTQFQISCEEEDKFVLIYALLKLKLINGRSIIFVNSIDRCYRLKLFLEQFGIHSCVLNSELPATSRCHVVQQFNDGIYDLVIATDEARDHCFGASSKEEGFQGESSKKKRKFDKDQESGVSRGIDFIQVSNVINFDFPRTVDDYIHRVGRTARGWNHGCALSFVTKMDRKVLSRVRKVLAAASEGAVLKPYRFRMEELDGFRYRAKDVLMAVSRKAVHEARLKEISDEILRSKRLKGYFAENPRDHQIIKHDADLQTVRLPLHLNHVPDYMVPPTLRGSFYDVPKRRKTKEQEMRRKRDTKRTTPGQKRFMKRKADPLKSFDAGGDSNDE